MRSDTKIVSRARLLALAAGVAVGLVLAALCEWQVVQPLVAENERVAAELAAARSENERTEQMVADYETFKADAEAIERQFAVALEAVPTEAELAGALQDLERVAEASGVDLVRFSPTPPTSSANAAGDTHGGVQVSAAPISVVVRADFATYKNLLARVASYPRLLAVDGFTVRAARSGSHTLEAALSLKGYYKQAPVAAGTPTREGA
jgi:Tfp pilus assembly protein PilO